MAIQKYTVQKGDTLGALSKKLGVGVNEFSGYQSGDPNKIREGETISYGSADTKPESSSYVDELKSQLGDTAKDTGTKKESDPYGLSSIKSQIEDATTKRDNAFAELKDVSTKTFNDEYAKRGLEEKKTKLSSIDGEIAAAKQVRDDAIAKVRSNPGLSAAQMTGDIKKVADYQNDVINNKISERNSVATEYNTGLAEIDKVVENTVKDKTLDYGYYDSTLKDLSSKVTDYTKAYREDLQNTSDANYKDRALSQALEIAKMNAEKKGAGSNLQLKSDPRTGDPLYWFDPDTGEITYINADGNASGGGSGDSFDALDKAVADNNTIDNGARWYNPFSWANYFK